MRFSFGNFSNFGNFNQDPNTGEYSWTPQRSSDDKPKNRAAPSPAARACS